jgi:hypothetical protein
MAGETKLLKKEAGIATSKGMPIARKTILSRLPCKGIPMLVLLFTGLLPAQEKALIALTSRDGRTIEGTVQSGSERAVKIKRKDGKEFEIAWNLLTEESAKLAKANIPQPAPPKIPEKPKHPDDIPEKIIVKIGEKARFSFILTKGKLHAPTKSADDQPDAPSFTVDFSKSDKSCSATLKQTFLPAVKVRCLARIKGRKDYFPTSIIDMQQGKPNFETWGDDLEELVFFGFEETEPFDQ